MSAEHGDPGGAAHGRTLFLCVAGEPGIGKTTLIERFLSELASSGRTVSVARGRCSERLAGAEAYLPIIEALDGLLEGPNGTAIADVMGRVAPSWFAQCLPSVDSSSPPVSQERRKREFCALVEELS
jgi:hypothetical protein